MADTNRTKRDLDELQQFIREKKGSAEPGGTDLIEEIETKIDNLKTSLKRDMQEVRTNIRYDVAALFLVHKALHEYELHMDEKDPPSKQRVDASEIFAALTDGTNNTTWNDEYESSASIQAGSIDEAANGIFGKSISMMFYFDKNADLRTQPVAIIDIHDYYDAFDTCQDVIQEMDLDALDSITDEWFYFMNPDCSEEEPNDGDDDAKTQDFSEWYQVHAGAMAADILMARVYLLIRENGFNSFLQNRVSIDVSDIVGQYVSSDNFGDKIQEIHNFFDTMNESYQMRGFKPFIGWYAGIAGDDNKNSAVITVTLEDTNWGACMCDPKVFCDNMSMGSNDEVRRMCNWCCFYDDTMDNVIRPGIIQYRYDEKMGWYTFYRNKECQCNCTCKTEPSEACKVEENAPAEGDMTEHVTAISEYILEKVREVLGRDKDVFLKADDRECKLILNLTDLIEGSYSQYLETDTKFYTLSRAVRNDLMANPELITDVNIYLRKEHCAQTVLGIITFLHLEGDTQETALDKEEEKDSEVQKDVAASEGKKASEDKEVAKDTDVTIQRPYPNKVAEADASKVSNYAVTPTRIGEQETHSGLVGTQDPRLPLTFPTEKELKPVIDYIAEQARAMYHLQYAALSHALTGHLIKRKRVPDPRMARTVVVDITDQLDGIESFVKSGFRYTYYATIRSMAREIPGVAFVATNVRTHKGKERRYVTLVYKKAPEEAAISKVPAGVHTVEQDPKVPYDKTLTPQMFQEKLSIRRIYKDLRKQGYDIEALKKCMVAIDDMLDARPTEKDVRKFLKKELAKKKYRKIVLKHLRDLGVVK